MKVIVGLGNIGDKYIGSRHNGGFAVVERLAGEGKWKEEGKFKALVCFLGEVMLVKPTTFMNGSGETVSKIVRFYKVELDDLWVIHDDLDLPLGEYRIQKGVGPKVHNGVNSVEELLGSKDFWRVRIGVDGREGDRSVPGDEYVLGRFRPEEREVMEKVTAEVVELLREKMGI